MLKKVKLKQGTLSWENAREKRIGSSEVFDIVRYYATDEELQNCGINAEHFKSEKPYTTAWALYHKVLNTGFYAREELAPEFAEYGHAVEPFGVKLLQKNRKNKLKSGEVYANEKLIASLDVSGIAEDIDEQRKFDYGQGNPKAGQKFVAEQKSMHYRVFKQGLPFKYIIQAQYQITYTAADFFILQLIILDEDTPFTRGKICQMGKVQRNTYLAANTEAHELYFANNEPLAQLIKICLQRFFVATQNKVEPKPYLPCDNTRNVIDSIRLNTFYTDKAIPLDADLTNYIEVKRNIDELERRKLELLNKFIGQSKEFNNCKFKCKVTNYTASFSKAGAFLLKEPKEQ